MRELKTVGLDVDGTHIICEATDPVERFVLRADDRLRSAMCGDQTRPVQTEIDIEVAPVLSPKEIQARIRAGETVEQLASSAGVEVSRIERFAHPVLLERARAAELATAAHPVLADGPAVESLLETVNEAFAARGLERDAAAWDAWKNQDGRWVVQLKWNAGRSENAAHFRFTLGAHGGTVTALDELASELIDPEFERPLRPVSLVAQLDFDDAEPATPAEPTAPVQAATAVQPPAPVQPTPPVQAVEPKKPAAKPSGRRARPQVPAWEDVLLGVRSSGQR